MGPASLVILVMGVSGTGKTTVGGRLASVLGWEFLDADDLHPPQNRAKMAAGTPLTDEDRGPWLLALRGEIREHLDTGRPLVLACSALKESYRRLLRAGDAPRIPIVHLVGPPELIRARMAARDHFMGPGMLESQLETLEPPRDALEIGIAAPVVVIVREIRTKLGV